MYSVVPCVVPIMAPSASQIVVKVELISISGNTVEISNSIVLNLLKLIAPDGCNSKGLVCRQ